MADFVHLHVHSHYSLLDGLGKIDELINRAKELEMPALALTDHGNMHGAIEFYSKCKKAGIKPILGVESYLAPRGMLDRVPKIDSAAYHQLLLAKNEVGYKNLLHLVSEAYTKGMYYKPRIDLPLLTKHAKGLIGTSSCLAGIIPEAIAAGDMERAVKLVKQFQDMFEGDFYLELQHHPSLETQTRVNDGLKLIARELKIDLIATSDVHYVRPEDKETHETLLAINTGHDLVSDDRMTFGDIDVSMRPEEDFRRDFADTPEVIANTKAIADKCHLELKLGENILPEFKVPDGFTPDSYLAQICQKGIPERYPDYATNTELKAKIDERLTFELKTVESMGFPSYFLIVADYVNWAKNNGIFVGPGRGSAAGSLLAYLAGITNIDPFPYGLLFERFLNPDRIEMPDIDMDFADDRRDEVISYIAEKYGTDHVAGIATFGTMMGRAAIRDVGRVLGIAYSEVDEIAKLVAPPVQGRHVPLSQSIANVPELKAKYESSQPIRKMLDLAVKLEGTVRHASQHACAFVICREPTTNYTPVQPATQGRQGVVTQYSMKPIAEIGLLKMDFLGLSNLTILRNAIRIIRKVYGVEIDLEKLPLDDKKTYELLSRGKTNGIFQFESDGMKRYIRELKPNRFEDIIAMGALYRPGPMQNIPNFIARKHGKEEVSYLHPAMANALGETFGIPVYQEQVMQATKDLAGFTGGQADTVRKAMGKKIDALMKEMKIKFVAGCKDHSNIDADLAEQIWKQFEDFAAYGFNKSHAAGYALISYQTAYLKANYPAAFFASLLTSNADNLDKMGVEMTEAGKMGIRVLPPDVNESFPEFGVIKQDKNEYIRFGLAAIKNVGLGVAEKIVRERQDNGPFVSLTDFLIRLGPSVVNRRVLESLAMCGGLDRFGERNSLVQSLDVMTKFLATGRKASDQMGLFGSDDRTLISELALIESPPLENRVGLEWEKSLLGIYLTGHPLKEIEGILPRIATPITQIASEHNGQNRRIGGLIGDIRVINTKTNEPMAFVKVEDMSGVIEVVVFPRTWTEARAFMSTDRYVVVDGRVDTRDGSPKLIASRVVELHPDEAVNTIQAALGPLPKTSSWQTRSDAKKPGKSSVKTKAAAPTKGRIILKLPRAMSKKTLEEIRFILEAKAGTTPVFIETNQGDTVRQAKTKTSVTATHDLILLLQQAGVETMLEDIELAPAQDVVIEEYAEDAEPVAA